MRFTKYALPRNLSPQSYLKEIHGQLHTGVLCGGGSAADCQGGAVAGQQGCGGEGGGWGSDEDAVAGVGAGGAEL